MKSAPSKGESPDPVVPCARPNAHLGKKFRQPIRWKPSFALCVVMQAGRVIQFHWIVARRMCHCFEEVSHASR
jgi:hypothetical protein